MSFQLPSVKPKPNLASHALDGKSSNFELPNLMLSGLSHQVNTPHYEHPLVHSEKQSFSNRQHLNNVILRNTQGLHAPLRLSMEMAAVKKVGHLPFLQSHNVLLDSLTGRDVEMSPEDIFNSGEFPEMMGMPHAMVEKQLGIM